MLLAARETPQRRPRNSGGNVDILRIVAIIGVWCNWQHSSFWYCRSRFESWYPSSYGKHFRHRFVGVFLFLPRPGNLITVRTQREGCRSPVACASSKVCKAPVNTSGIRGSAMCRHQFAYPCQCCDVYGGTLGLHGRPETRPSRAGASSGDTWGCLSCRPSGNAEP